MSSMFIMNQSNTSQIYQQWFMFGSSRWIYFSVGLVKDSGVHLLLIYKVYWPWHLLILVVMIQLYFKVSLPSYCDTKVHWGNHKYTTNDKHAHPSQLNDELSQSMVKVYIVPRSALVVHHNSSCHCGASQVPSLISPGLGYNDTVTVDHCTSTSLCLHW